MPLTRNYRLLGLMMVACCAFAAGAGAQEQPPTADSAARGGGIASAADEWQRVMIGFVGHNRYEPQTAAALAGARAAAAELGPLHRLHVSVAAHSPDGASAQQQNEALRTLFVQGAGGVLINPVDSEASASVLLLLQRQRMPVVTFGNTDALEGISGSVVDDETAIGETLAREAFHFLAARRVRRGGGIAILAAPQGQEPYAQRQSAAGQVIGDSPDHTLYGVYPTQPDLGSALATLARVTAAERDDKLNIWLSLGGWPLRGDHANLPRGRDLVGIVAAGGLPRQLPYLARGEVLSLVSPDYYQLGYEAMRFVLEAQRDWRTTSDEPEALATATDKPASATNAAVAANRVAATNTTNATTEAAAATAEAAEDGGTGSPVRRLKVPPRTIRQQGLDAYAAEWAQWLSQPM